MDQVHESSTFQGGTGTRKKRRLIDVEPSNLLETPAKTFSGPVAKKSKTFLGVFVPPRPRSHQNRPELQQKKRASSEASSGAVAPASSSTSASEANQCQDVISHALPRLRPRQTAQEQSVKVSHEEGESQDPDYEFEEHEEEDHDDEGESEDEDYQKGKPRTPMAKSLPRRLPKSKYTSSRPPRTADAIHSRNRHLLAVHPKQISSSTSEPDTTFRFLKSYSCDCLTDNGQNSEKNCKVLSLYGYYYHPVLNLIICPEHRRAVLLEHWHSHLKNSHKADHPGTLKQADTTLMKAHVAESFGAPETLADLKLPASLERPLFMHQYFEGTRPSIAGRYLCPENGCKTEVAVTPRTTSSTMSHNHALHKHVKQAHNKSLKEYTSTNPRPRWTQAIMLKPTPAEYHVFLLPDNFSEDDLRHLAPPQLIASASTTSTNQHGVQSEEGPNQEADWMHIIGWSEYRKTIGVVDYCALMSLVENPGTRGVRLKGSDRWLDSGLSEIYRMCGKYLPNAYESVKHLHHGVRATITERALKGSYNELTPSTYRKYGRVLSQTVAMTLRIIHKSVQNPEDHTLPALKCTRTQLEAALALYTVIIEARGNPQKDKLLHQLHLFLDTLLRPGDLSADTIACPTDQLLFVLSIRNDDTYATASTVASSSAALQYSFRSILVQIVRHILDENDTFTWFQPPAQPRNSKPEDRSTDGAETNPQTNSEDETETETEDEDEDEDDEELELPNASETAEEEENLEADLDEIMGKIYAFRDAQIGEAEVTTPKKTQNRERSLPSQTYISLLKNEMKWLSGRPNFGETTPFSRMYHVWFNVHQHSYEDTGTMTFIPDDDGYRWMFGRHGSQTEPLDMRLWSTASETAITTFRDAIITLIPSCDSCELMDKFCTTPFRDDKTRFAPHRQAPNKAWMSNLQQGISQRVRSKAWSVNGQFNSRQAKRWLQLEQTALQALAYVCSLTTGITFRSWQFSSILYDCTDEQNRNVWILHDGTAIISHPKAKQRNIDRAPTLLALPRKVSSIVAFYLYIIRPVACELLTELQLDSSAHQSILWVHSIPIGREKSRIGSPWNGGYFSRLLREFNKREIGVAGTPLLIRQASQAVFRDKLPQLFDKGSNLTGLDEYWHRSGFPFWSDLSPECSVRLLAVSQLWQALLQITPFDPIWMPMIQGSHTFFSQKSENLEIAILGAFKRLHGGDASDKKISVSDLEYLLGVRLHRNKFLVPILGELLFGHNSKRVDETLPIWGLHVETVARGIQILAAFNESSSPLLSDPLASMLDCYSYIYDDAVRGLTAYRLEFPVVWDQLGIEVYSSHQVPSLLSTTKEVENSIELIISCLEAV